MIKNFHWGHGIFIFYVVFVGAVITAFVASRSVDHALVTEEYYKHDIAYQQRYDKEINQISESMIECKYDAHSKLLMVKVKDAKSVGGNILLYRPSDKSQDRTIKVSGPLTSISTIDMSKGRWKVIIDCNVDTKSYYKEESIYI